MSGTVATKSYLSKRGYVIRKESITTEQLVSLKLELRGKPLVDDKYNLFNRKDITFPLYIETKTKIYIPKVYGITHFGMPDNLTDNYKGQAWDSDLLIDFTGSLHPYQKEPCEILINELQNGSTGGILSLSTGFGKTVCALYLLSVLKRKTLIIVNKVSLLKQWEREIQTFLPGTEIGFIQGQKNVDVNGKHVVIAMLQSLAKIDYPDTLFEEFGVTLVDEIHNVSSPVFSRVLMRVNSMYTIGLSATPKRSDGCEYVFKWFIGDIVYKSTTERRGLHPIVQVIKINSSDYQEIATVNKITGQKQIMFSSMLSELTTMAKRNRLIIELLKQKVTEQKRKVLVLSDRREHVKTLKKLLDEDGGVNFTYGLFLGQMKMTELERSKACQVILATYQAFGEGVSERELDTLFLVTPKKFIGHLQNTTKAESGKLEQIVGRIFRKEHSERHPLIVDFQDNFSVYTSQSKQRLAFYKTHFSNIGFQDCQVDLDKHELMSITAKIIVIKKETNTDTDTPIEDNQLSKNMYQQCLLD
uniref:Helicase ATP-binding domain-containing protein n=1 Tax=viral metagenome TaxID=1070528 RepID=A0A6C0H7N3_9ZZZZ